MIAKLSGRMDSSGEGWAVIDVGGVGYLVFCASRTLSTLPDIGAPVSLQIETVVREDQFNLYGFLDGREREWFRLLRTVQSVGAKMALAILGLLSPDELALAIAARDKASLTRVSGVGPKLVERMLTELKDKAPAGEMSVAALGGAVSRGGSGGSSVADAVSALVNLGYRQSDAFNVVSGIALNLGDEVTLENLIQTSLKELSA